MKKTLTDDQIMNAVCTAADALDATRVSELRVGGWHATTIFDGDSGLLRLGRLIEKAVQAAHPEGGPRILDEREIKSLAKAAGLPKYIWDTDEARMDLARFAHMAASHMNEGEVKP